MNTSTEAPLTAEDLSAFIDDDLRRLEAQHADMITPAAKSTVIAAILKQSRDVSP